MKTAGAVLILAFSLYAGLAAAWEEKRRVRTLEAFCRMLSAVKEEISVLRLPGKEIFSRFSDPFLEETGFLPAVRNARDPVKPLYEALTQPAVKRRLSLAKEEYETLLRFAEDFGSGDSVRECARCDAALLPLGSALSKAGEDAPGNARILRAVSMCGGILLVLLLF